VRLFRPFNGTLTLGRPGCSALLAAVFIEEHPLFHMRATWPHPASGLTRALQNPFSLSVTPRLGRRRGSPPFFFGAFFFSPTGRYSITLLHFFDIRYDDGDGGLDPFKPLVT